MAPPRVFISYSHDSTTHEDRVLALADRLRADGIDAMIDLYEPFPPQGWPAWCDAQIRQSDFVLMVCTQTYLRRVDGDEEAGVGRGVLWEGRLIKQQLYNTGSVARKFVPVLFADGSEADVPVPVAGATIHRVETAEGYEALLRLMTNQPLTPMPLLGRRRKLPARQRQSLAETSTGKSLPVGDLFEAEIEISVRLKALARLPCGPAVDPFVVEFSIKRAFAGAADAVQAAAIVSEASNLVISALEKPPRNRHIYVIVPASLPNPQVVGLLNYWASVFDEACFLGPRMVGALLLFAPPVVLKGVKSDIIELFTKLEAWR